jgi:hypothetical protein
MVCVQGQPQWRRNAITVALPSSGGIGRRDVVGALEWSGGGGDGVGPEVANQDDSSVWKVMVERVCLEFCEDG